MKITFLGTGTSQGVPIIGCPCEVCQSLDYCDKRLRSSVHITSGQTSFVIDTGPDFRQQMIREGIKQLDAIIYTHAHRDHTAGLDDVRAYNFLQEMDMPLYATPEVHEQVKADFSYIFTEKNYPGLPRVKPVVINEGTFSLNGISILPLPVMHYKLPVMGFRIGNFSYITDANFIPDTTYERLKGTEVLVLNALQKQQHISHFNLEEALKVVEKINPVKTFFTHISHKLGLHAEIEKELPPTVSLAFDGLQLSL